MAPTESKKSVASGRGVSAKKRILIIDGHPDPSPERYIHALASAYGEAAKQQGHKVRVVKLAECEFPSLARNDDYLHSNPPDTIATIQDDFAWSTHVAVFFPLWLGDMPAKLKALFEQVLRPGFAYKSSGKGFPKQLLKGRSARIVVTMGMPALFYRWYFRAHSLKSLVRNIFHFVGIRPVGLSIVGRVESMSDKHRQTWLDRMRRLGGAGQ